MPLTVEMFAKNGERPGHLIVDRKSFIFSFPEYNTRNLFYMFLQKHPQIETSMPEATATSTFAMTEDPRHNILEHLSSYDHEQYHVHIVLTVDVNFSLLKQLFDQMDIASFYDSGLDDVMCQESRKSILDIAEKYFAELESVEAQKIEAQYRQMKDAEYGQVNHQIKLAKERAERNPERKDDLFEHKNDETSEPTPEFFLEFLVLRIPMNADNDYETSNARIINNIWQMYHDILQQRIDHQNQGNANTILSNNFMVQQPSPLSRFSLMNRSSSVNSDDPQEEEQEQKRKYCPSCVLL
jgi:hypothetical protein